MELVGQVGLVVHEQLDQVVVAELGGLVGLGWVGLDHVFQGLVVLGEPGLELELVLGEPMIKL